VPRENTEAFTLLSLKEPNLVSGTRSVALPGASPTRLAETVEPRLGVRKADSNSQSCPSCLFIEHEIIAASQVPAHQVQIREEIQWTSGREVITKGNRREGARQQHEAV
jgi:hypothetical protein